MPNPIPLCFVARGVIDDRDRAALRSRAALATRSQRTDPELACERRIRLVASEHDDLIEQGHRPQMRVLDESFTAVIDERIEQTWTGRGADTGNAFINPSLDRRGAVRDLRRRWRR